MGIDFYYSIFCLFIMIIAGFVFYLAIFDHNKICIILICVNLAIAYGDYVYSKRHDTFLYGFMKGLTGEKTNPKEDIE